MKHILSMLLLCMTFSSVIGQQAYFIDGYHGGVYGHYPIEWKTKFITDLITDNPEWRMSLEIEPETWDVVAEKTPEDYKNFKRIVTSDRIEFTNPTYAQPYCYNISGESIIRQFDYGIKSIRKHFPTVEFNTYSVEEPCFTSSLPQILQQFGFKYAVLKCPNTCWGGYTAPYGGELVNWIGPDGTSILTVPRYETEELEENSVWQTTAWSNDTKYIEAALNYGIKNPVGMTLQDAGWNGGPWLGTGDDIKNNSIYVTWKEYFENISIGKTDDNYHLSQEDIRVSLMWGSQVLQRIAKQVRQSENNIIMAEKMGVIANISNGYCYNQEDTDEAWRSLMLAQHHDSWIVPYNNLYDQTTWADAISEWTNSSNMISSNITSSAINSFDNETTKAEEGVYLRLYNTLGISRREIVSSSLPDIFIGKDIKVTDSKGNTVEAYCSTIKNIASISLEVEVPAFGYSTYHIEALQNNKKKVESPKQMKRNESLFVLENSMYQITLDLKKGGTVKSLIAKREDNKEFVDTNSDYSIGEMRGFFYDEGVYHSSKDTSAEITIITNNEYEQSVQINGLIASHPFTQVITIREGQKKIDFELFIDWKENVGIGEYAQDDAFSNNRRAFYDDRYKLNVLFPVNLKSPIIHKNAPFDVCKSELDNTHFNTWDNIKHNIILNWLDLSEEDNTYGFALLSDHTTSYSYGDDFPLGLTVQYSGNGLWGRDYLIDAPTNIKFAIIPHSNKWDKSDISNESLRWNEPLISEYTKDSYIKDKSLINIDGTGYELSASYLSGNDVVVRLFNAHGDDSPQIIKLDDTHFSRVEEIDLNGKVVASLDKIILSNNLTGVELDMPRFGIRTIRLVR